jgi:thioredoxin-dependent peroxiredoxin
MLTASEKIRVRDRVNVKNKSGLLCKFEKRPALFIRKIEETQSMGETDRHKTRLKAGDRAPSFKGIDQHNKEVRLGDFTGKKLILYFYPEDDTPGCTTQSCNLRDNYESLLKYGYEVVGVSADSVRSHQRFAKRYNLSFSLIADEKKEIINAYDVWGKKKVLGIPFTGLLRTTFVINEQGIIEGVIDNVDTGNHSSQVLTLSKTLLT